MPGIYSKTFTFTVKVLIIVFEKKTNWTQQKSRSEVRKERNSYYLHILCIVNKPNNTNKL